MIKKIFIFCFTLLISNSIFSQNNFRNTDTNFPKEKVFLHTNTNFFITGEQILYSIYCLDSKKNIISELSKIAYVEIINSDNISIYKQKISLKDGKGYGDIFLKSSLKTGTYKLISYTQWMRNEQSFFEETIFIVNPFSNKLVLADSIKKNNFNVSSFKNTNNLKINFSKNNYSKREKIELDLKDYNQSNISISVRKTDNISLPKKTNSSKFINEYYLPKKNSNKIYLPELRGELVEGKITSDNNNVGNKKIGISFIGENKITKISSTNSTGNFYFNVNKNYSSDNVIIQVLEETNNNYNIELINPKLEKRFSDFEPLYLTEDLRKLIKEKSKYIQIENAYSSVKKTESKTPTNNTFVFNKNTNKVVYNLDDFTRFKTVKEVAVEILQDVWLSKNDDKYTFKLRDINLASSNTLSTLLIVDGFLVLNHNDFVDFDALKIKTIEVIKEKYYYGSNLYQGILNIETFKNAYTPRLNTSKQFTLLKPQKEKIYFHPDYSNSQSKNIPDLRTQLYWNPNVNNPKSLSFFTSDILGNYKIEIQGFTKKGKPIYKEVLFTVK
jgi:hypothetical protein